MQVAQEETRRTSAEGDALLQQLRQLLDGLSGVELELGQEQRRAHGGVALPVVDETSSAPSTDETRVTGAGEDSSSSGGRLALPSLTT